MWAGADPNEIGALLRQGYDGVQAGQGISALHLDAANRVWAGGDNGTICVWAESSASQLCPPLAVAVNSIA